MATQQERELVAAATAKRAENPTYKPTLAEIKAVDAVLIDQAKQRMGSPPSNQTQPPVAAPAQPEKTLAERFADSLEAAMEWVKSAAGKVLQVKPGGWYIGQVRHADEHHAVQAQGGGNYVIHRQEDLPQRLDVSPASVEIRYGRDGRVSKLEVKPQQSRGLGLGG